MCLSRFGARQGIPWCTGVINELAQRGWKEERAQDGFGDHHYLKGFSIQEEESPHRKLKEVVHRGKRRTRRKWDHINQGGNFKESYSDGEVK